VPLPEKTSISVILGQATGPQVPGSRRAGAAGGHRHPGPRLHRAPDGGRYGTGKVSRTTSGRRFSEDTIADGAWGHLGQLCAGPAGQGRCSDPARTSEMVVRRRHRQRTCGPQAGSDRRLLRRACPNTSGLAGAIVATIQRGYDLTWLDGYPEAVKALTRAEVNNAIKTHLDPAHHSARGGGDAEGRDRQIGGVPVRSSEVSCCGLSFCPRKSCLPISRPRLPEDVIGGGHVKVDVRQPHDGAGRACPAWSFVELRVCHVTVRSSAPSNCSGFSEPR